jgi:hypothetical protein
VILTAANVHDSNVFEELVDACVVGAIPQAGGALREAGRYPRGVPASRLFADLLQLPVVRVLQGTLRRGGTFASLKAA